MVMVSQVVSWSMSVKGAVEPSRWAASAKLPVSPGRAVSEYQAGPVRRLSRLVVAFMV